MMNWQPQCSLGWRKTSWKNSFRPNRAISVPPLHHSTQPKNKLRERQCDWFLISGKKKSARQSLISTSPPSTMMPNKKLKCCPPPLQFYNKTCFRKLSNFSTYLNVKLHPWFETSNFRFVSGRSPEIYPSPPPPTPYKKTTLRRDKKRKNSSKHLHKLLEHT